MQALAGLGASEMILLLGLSNLSLGPQLPGVLLGLTVAGWGGLYAATKLFGPG